jgi:chemotaxis protein MotB
MPDEKLARVVGLASSILLIEGDPFSPANRRISITVMTREAEERLMGASRPAPAPEPGLAASGAAPAASQ